MADGLAYRCLLCSLVPHFVTMRCSSYGKTNLSMYGFDKYHMVFLGHFYKKYSLFFSFFLI